MFGLGGVRVGGLGCERRIEFLLIFYFFLGGGLGWGGGYGLGGQGGCERRIENSKKIG